MQNDFEEAIRWFKEAIQSDPGDAEIHYRCSITYGRSGKLEPAVFHAEKAVELHPDHEGYQLHLHHVKALQLVQQARKLVENKIQPASTDLYLAAQLLKSAVSMDPLDPEAYVWLALVYTELNEHPLAISTLKEVIGLYPQESGLQHLMEELKQRLRQYLQDS
nr:tetratricopeptide repeat protein [Paenibacillus lemnae]